MKLEFYITNQEKPITALEIIENYMTQKRYSILAQTLKRVFVDLASKNVKMKDITKVLSV